MQKIQFYLIFGLILVTFGCSQKQNYIVKGTILNPNDSIISISIGADLLTGQYPSNYKTEYEIDENASFRIPLIVESQNKISLFYNKFRERIDLILLEKGEVIISVDGNNHVETLKFAVSTAI